MYFSRSPWSAVPGESTYARYGDELKVQRVAGCWEAVGIFFEDGHPEGHGDGLQTERVLQPITRVSGVAAGLVDDLRHPVQIDVLSVEPERGAGKRDLSFDSATARRLLLRHWAPDLVFT